MKPLVLTIVAACLSGCAVTFRPDGSRTYTADPDMFLRAIEVIAEK